MWLKKKKFLSSVRSPSKRKIQSNDLESPRMKYSKLFGAYWGIQTICEEFKQTPRDYDKNHANRESGEEKKNAGGDK